jgi:murein L,D-transpeptidase YcbB/YkuD
MRAMRIRCALLVAVSAAVLVGGCARDRGPSEAEVRDALARTLHAARPPFDADSSRRTRRVWEEARRFYDQNGMRLVWSNGTSVHPAVDALVRALAAADREGLDPATYDGPALGERRRSFTRETAAEFDVRCTYAYLRYAWDLTHGSIDPEKVAPQWHAARRGDDPSAALKAAVATGAIESSLARLGPQAPQYQALRRQLAKARERQDAAAVDQIAMNMDRWRWLPDDLGARYLIVNIPAFRLDAIENGKSVLSMKVITGKNENPTPVLADEMTSIVFSPYWNIPASIVEKEIVPKLERDPDYLARNNMEADESGTHYRQRPGRGNSLGAVKFVFPNHFNVYLHGTPSASLFKRVERDFSHGCVRLEDPLALAMYVLRDQPEWTKERIVAAMNAGTERSVKLTRPLPIYLVYFTAWDEDGALRTARDVYGLDRRHAAVEDA